MFVVPILTYKSWFTSEHEGKVADTDMMKIHYLLANKYRLPA